MIESFKLNNFDLIRIIAATQVMIIHTLSHLDMGSYWWAQGLKFFPGVPIFFVTSGFLISASLERSNSIREYAMKRCLRIYPALWCCLTATIITVHVFGFDILSREIAIWLPLQAAGVIYTPQSLKDFGFGSYNGSLWTIPVELQFYFILPFFYFMFKGNALNRRIWLVFGVFLAISICIKILFPNMGKLGLENWLEKLLRSSFIPHIYLFLFGVAMQRSRIYSSYWIREKPLYWLFAYAVVVSQIGSTTLGSFCALLILGVLTISVAYSFPRMADRLLRGNDISYGTYIYHGLILNIFIEMGIVGKLTYLPIVMVLTYVVAFCSWRFVEHLLIRRRYTIAGRVSRKASVLT